MTFTTILFILLMHWLADFCLQTDWQAKNKSTNDWALTSHISVYSLVWFFASYLLLGNWNCSLIFALITFGCHWATDWATSRIGKPFWDRRDTHNGFVVVGFDQVLHYVQLFLTYTWVKELV